MARQPSENLGNIRLGSAAEAADFAYGDILTTGMPGKKNERPDRIFACLGINQIFPLLKKSMKLLWEDGFTFFG